MSSISRSTAHRIGRLGVACVAVGILSACAQPKTMYNWQSYQPQVYSYLKDEGGDHAVQAQALEQNIETARSANQALPPGFHAHLGMLYLKMGQGDKAVEQLQSEKLAFPESTPFMDFLLRNVSGPAAVQNGQASTEKAGGAADASPAGQRESAPASQAGKEGV